MSNKGLVGKRVHELKELLRKKEVSASDILSAHLEHIDRNNSKIDAFNCLTSELAKKQAARVDQMVAAGEPLPALAGIPVAVKDNMCVPGYATTCSSKILKDFVPPYEATAVNRLFNAGALLVGKTNMDEFAMGSSTENSAFKRTLNPWNTEYVPGGSSGGSAAAVASGFSVVALGSDTGGSVRQPAGFCGCVGMKPTYGLVSRFGLVAYASSLDQIGPLGRSVEDVAITLSVIAGHDNRDSTSLPSITRDGAADNVDFAEGLAAAGPEELCRGLKVGIIKELIGDGIDEEVRTAVLAAADIYKTLGAAVTEVSIPHVKYALPVYYLIATAEASANLARFDGVRYGYRNSDADDLSSMYMATRQEGFGAEVKRRIILGTYGLSSGYYDAYYKKAQQVRRLIKSDFDNIFNQVNLLICPIAPTVAFKFNEKTEDPLTMYLSDIASIPANLAGLPGISIPGGFAKNGLPIGVQILGDALSDRQVLRAAAAFEKATAYSTKDSPILECGKFNGAAR